MRKILVLLFCVGFLAVACATAPVKLQPVAGAPKVELNKYDTLIVEVSKAEALEMSKEDLEGMGTLITQAIRKHCPRFKQVVANGLVNNSLPNSAPVLEIKFIEFVRPSAVNFLLPTWATPSKIPRIASEIVLKDSGGKPIMSGPLSKHLGSTLAGGEQAGLKDGFRGAFRTFGWLKERFAEGVAKGLVF